LKPVGCVQFVEFRAVPKAPLKESVNGAQAEAGGGVGVGVGVGVMSNTVPLNVPLS
jgi:hypothetical protein